MEKTRAQSPQSRRKIKGTITGASLLLALEIMRNIWLTRVLDGIDGQRAGFSQSKICNVLGRAGFSQSKICNVLVGRCGLEGDRDDSSLTAYYCHSGGDGIRLLLKKSGRSAQDATFDLRGIASNKDLFREFGVRIPKDAWRKILCFFQLIASGEFVEADLKD